MDQSLLFFVLTLEKYITNLLKLYKEVVVFKGKGLLKVLILSLFVVVTGSCDVGTGGLSNGEDSGDETIKKFTLTVDNFGKGVVISDISGVNCGDDCSESYPAGTTIVLRATAKSDSELLSWAGCDSTTANTCTITMDSDKTVFPTFALNTMVLQPSAKILDDATMQYLVKQMGSTYYFDSRAVEAASLQSGDVIASGSGNGLLRRVTAISVLANGEIMIDTSDATLEDVIKEGTVAYTGKLTYNDIQSSKALIEGVSLRKSEVGSSDFIVDINAIIYDEDGDNNTTLDQVRLVGNTTMTFEPDLALSFGLAGIEEFKFILISKNSQNLKIEAGGNIPLIDIKKPIKTFHFGAIPLGPFVVAVPKVTVYVGIKGGAGAALSSKVTMEAKYIAGVWYKKTTGWEPVSTYSSKFGFSTPNIKASAFIKGYVGPEFKFYINDVAGPFVDLEGYLKARANASLDYLKWIIYGGIGASAGSKVEILSWLLAEYRANLFEKEWELTSGSTGSVIDSSQPTKPTSLTATAVSSNQINLSWDKSTDDIGVAGYKIYKDGKPFQSVTTTTFIDTDLTSLIRYCYTVSSYDDAENESVQSTQVCATTPPAFDTTPPSDPSSLFVKAISSNQIDVSWNASSDEVAVAGYKVYRNGIPIKSVTTTSTSNTGLSPDTLYCYTVSAFDAAGNESGQSSQECVRTGSGSIILQPDPLEGLDVWITSYYSYGDDYGVDDYKLRVGGWGDYYYTLIKFDLTGLPSKASSAKVYLYTYGNAGGSNVSMYLDRVTSVWDEAVGWYSKPSTTYLRLLPPATLDSWYVFDITELYNDWQAGIYPNYGVQLRPTSVNNQFNEFYSSDYSDDPLLRPKLVVTP